MLQSLGSGTEQQQVLLLKPRSPESRVWPGYQDFQKAPGDFTL